MKKLIESNVDKKINTFMPEGYKAESTLIEIKLVSFIKVKITAPDGEYILNEFEIDTWMGELLECVLRMTLQLKNKEVRNHKEYVGIRWSKVWSDELKELAEEVGYKDVWEVI